MQSSPAAAVVLGASLVGLVWAPCAAVATPMAHRPASGRQRASEVAFTPGLVAAPGVSVTMAPVGLSIEYPVMAEDLGGEACPPPALAAELQRLGSPPLQLAGASQDLTAPAGASPNPSTSWETATLYSLPAPFWSQLRCLLAQAKDPLTAGLNMKTGNLSWASQMVAGAQSAASNGSSFSLGNEPDLYGLPNYASLDKRLPGAEAAAANLYLQLAGYLSPAIAGAPTIGPELARAADWRGVLPRVIGQLHQTVGIHLYPLTACRTPRAVTIDGLLSAEAADGPARLSWVVADARAAGDTAIISEANSASCGGLAGVSDRPAAGVWAARFVLSALKAGFGEVRFHFSGNPYDPFIVRNGQILARPLESALVALNRWLPPGATLRTVRGVRELVASAAARPGGGIVLILDNERATARPIVLRSARSVQVAALSPIRVGLQVRTLSPAHGRIRLSVAPNSLVAISGAS